MAGSKTSTEMAAWLTRTIAQHAGLSVAQIDPDTLLSEYGLSSISAFAVINDIEDTFHMAPDVTVIWDYPTVNQLSVFLAELVAAR